MASLMIVLSREEIQATINYPLICETMCGTRWQTSNRTKRWSELFTESERQECVKLKTQAYTWHLRAGVPDEVTMSFTTMALWKKLEAFCATL